MRINLITVDNGVGLTQDMEIVRGLLKGHEVRFIDVLKGQPVRADVNIFMEIINRRFYKFARKNIFFPNPEWFMFKEHLNGIDIVLCKTRDAEEIFQKFGCRTIYTSFTSRDMKTEVAKERIYLHLAGKSSNKGSMKVWQAWNENNLPPLIFSRINDHARYDTNLKNNVRTVFERMSEADVKQVLNKCYFHVCTSEYEGFGHYIWEAKSAGGIVLTTDAPPMKDFVRDGYDGFLVPVKNIGRQQVATLGYVSAGSICDTVNRTRRLTEKECIELSNNARLSWESNDKYFKQIFKQIIGFL